MATGAGNAGVPAGEWERGVVVIERRRHPRGRVVAHLALLRKSRLNVIGVGRGIEPIEVARHASACRQVVIVVHVALRALNTRMGAGEREPG